MLKTRYDVGRIDSTSLDDKGYLKAEAYATRTGVFTYMMLDGSLRRELRSPEEVFSKESMESLAEVVITNDHPPVPLDSRNTKQYAVGWTGEKVRQDENFIQVDTKITEYTTIYDILEKNKKELSCGYSCEVEHVSGEYNGERYDAIQRNIRYNHLSVVERGRAGPDVKMKVDSKDCENVGVMKMDHDDQKKDGAKNTDDITSNKSPSKKEKVMPKIKVDGVEHEITEGLVSVWTEKTKELETIKADKEAVSEEKEKLQGKVDSLEGELEKANAKIKELESAEVSDEEILKRADELTKVHKIAKEVMGDEFKSDGLSLFEIKKMVVAKAKPELDVESKSDGYVEGVFDFISETHKDNADMDLKSALGNTVKKQTSKFDNESLIEASQKKDKEAFESYKGM